MIIETGLRLAGPGAVAVRRPRGVVHVYLGRLTRSRQAVPAAGRPLCGTRTRRLRVVSGCSLHVRASLVRLCARCARLLERLRPAAWWPRTREEYLERFAGVTMLELAHAAEAAETAEELAAVAHISLALYGQADCQRIPVPRPYGDVTLHELVRRLRATRFEREERAAWGESLSSLAVVGYETARAERSELRRLREERVARIGMSNAQPAPRKRNR